MEPLLLQLMVLRHQFQAMDIKPVKDMVLHKLPQKDTVLQLLQNVNNKKSKNVNKSQGNLASKYQNNKPSKNAKMYQSKLKSKNVNKSHKKSANKYQNKLKDKNADKSQDKLAPKYQG